MARHSLLTGVLLGVAILSYTPAPAHAQGGMVPAGSYLNSCRDVSFNPATNLLDALCDFNDPGGLMAKGEPVKGPPFNVTGCVENSIWNDNGQLYCFTDKAWGRDRVIPRGSYIATCTRRRVVNNVLLAECDDSNDDTHFAQLNLNGCKWGGDISNDNGRLKCESMLATHTHEFQPSAPAPLVKPVAVEPAVVKPVTVTPLDPADPSATDDPGGEKRKKRRSREERG